LAVEIAVPAADTLPQVGERPFSAPIVLQSAHLVHEVVTGSPIGLPAWREGFVMGEDFFDDEVGGPGGAVTRPLALKRAQARPQLRAVLLRLREAVDVVDAHAVDEPLRVKPKQRTVNGLAHFIILDADGDELVDIEETAPVDFVIRG